MSIWTGALRSALLLFAVGGLTACTPRQLIVDSLADELASASLASERDLDLVRDAAPFHLKLSEAVLAQQPAHAALAEAVAAGFTQYAYAFVAVEADEVEAQDARRADRLRQRAAGLYERAQGHALRALVAHQPGFAEALAAPEPAQGPPLARGQVGLAYWGAAAWGGWIALSKDRAEVLADLPRAQRLAELAWRTDPAWGRGALSGLLASYEAARPGGSRARALTLFDLAITQSQGQLAGPLVGKAEGYALPAGDRPLFEALLAQALAVRDQPGSPDTLQNDIMRRRAGWLLQQAGDLF